MTMIDQSPDERSGQPLPPPLPPPRLPYEHRWARSTDDKVIGGVAGGVAASLAVDAVWVRIAFVVLALLGGAGIPLYVAAWLALPESPTAAPTSSARRVVAGVIAVMVLASGLTGAWWFGDGDGIGDGSAWLLALALAAVAVALWHRDGDVRDRRPPADATSSLTGVLSDTEQSLRVEKRPGRYDERLHRYDERRRARVEERRNRPRSRLGWAGLGLAGVAGAITWLIAEGRSDQGQLSFGVATIVLGATIVVATFAGRARWLVVPAGLTFAAALAAGALSFAGASMSGSYGDHSIDSGSGLQDRYDFAAGDVTLYAGLFNGEPLGSAGPRALRTTITLGAGRIQVYVPDTAAVEITGRVGAGTITIFGQSIDGYREQMRVTRDAQRVGEIIDPRRITLQLNVGMGAVEVVLAGDQPLPFTPDSDVLRQYVDGTVLLSDGTVQTPNGTIFTDGTYTLTIAGELPDGTVVFDDGTTLAADGTVTTSGGFVITAADRGLQPVLEEEGS
jgi:phage shock protein PspC (stress-responsive transcriptional regulator)